MVWWWALLMNVIFGVPVSFPSDLREYYGVITFVIVASVVWYIAGVLDARAAAEDRDKGPDKAE